MKKFIGIGAFTIVEVAGLVAWLALALQDQALLGLGILAGALSLEHIITYFVIPQLPKDLRAPFPLLSILAFSGIETVIWGVWLLLAQSLLNPFTALNLFAAAAFLAIALLIEHTLSDNVFRSRGLFSKIIEARTIGFTIIEVVAASVWLLLVLVGQPVIGTAVLLVGSFVEHNIAVKVAQR